MMKVYYQLTMHQQSPLRISNSGSEKTDLDLMKDSRGFPFIPGTSLTGVLRELAEKTFADDRYKQLLLSLFGSEKRSDYEKGFSESHVIISDATLPSDTSASKIFLGVRDGIGVDEWGITIDGAKYDFEVVETEMPYTAILEWTGDEAKAEENSLVLEPLMKLAAQGISLGARTTRGYGKMDVEVRKLMFRFPEDLEEWLAFDPFDTTLFQEALSEEAADVTAEKLEIHMELEAAGGFSVQVYTTEEDEDRAASDVKPLSNSRSNPVIPGTTWAGAFRHHMIDLLREAPFASLSREQVNRLFGLKETGDKLMRSKITFSETEILGGKDYTITRNSVDRFSGAPRNTALFTSTVHEGGRGRLVLTVSKKEMTSDMTKLLTVTIFDLHAGLMTVGGEAAVGRGCMKVSGIKVNGNDCSDKLYAYDLTMLEG